MVLPNGSEYKTVLLDTNILQTLVTDPTFSGRLLMRFCLKQPISIFCFSIYNVIELKNKRSTDNGKVDIYTEFVKFFSIIPCLMLFPYKSLIQEEFSADIENSTVKINGNIANAFNPVVNRVDYSFDKWLNSLFDTQSIVREVQNNLAQMPGVVNDWMNQRSSASISAQELEKIRKSQEEDIVLRFINDCGIASNGLDYTKFPAARTMLYSQFRRVHCTNKQIYPNDVMDVEISAFAPYVNAVVTESGQADIYKKAKKVIPQLANLEIISIREI